MIRYMLTKDYKDVISIEREVFDYPWTARELRNYLNKNSVQAYVCEEKETLLGYVIYEVGKRSIELANIAVTEHVQRTGIATRLVDRVKEKLAYGKVDCITAKVRETNMGTLLFLKAIGFRATEVMWSPYDDESDEDAYLMEYCLEPIYVP